MQKNKKLSESEIDTAIQNIRKLYDDYIIQYMKGIKVKNDFEERYLHALRHRMDLSAFVRTEREVIRDMAKREEERIQLQYRKAQRQGARLRTSKAEDSKESFADRILAENRERIEKYPDLSIHEDASFELKKLFGTLNQLDREYWPLFERVLKGMYPSLYSGPRVLIESRMIELCRPSTSGVPPRLMSYQTELSKFPRSYTAIDREEKQCILSAAFLLHLISSECEKVLSAQDIKPDERADVEKVSAFVHTVIEDFRLKDLKEDTKENTYGSRSNGNAG